MGATARSLSDIQSTGTSTSLTSVVLSIVLSMILSSITVVSFARKSGVQQILSVEDFYGGLFLGFLIGILGQNFALSLISPKQ